MKKFFIVIMVLSFGIGILAAENIHTKNGLVIKNVKIVKKDSKWIYYKMSTGQIRKISKEGVSKIDKIPFNPKLQSKIKNEIPIPQITQQIQQNKKNITKNVSPNLEKYEYPNVGFLSVSFLSFLLSYDLFKDANKLDNDIDYLNLTVKSNEENFKTNIEIIKQTSPGKANELENSWNQYKFKENEHINELKEVKKRKQILSAVFLATGIITTVFALEPIKINASPNKITLSLNF